MHVVVNEPEVFCGNVSLFGGHVPRFIRVLATGRGSYEGASTTLATCFSHEVAGFFFRFI